jgi:Photosynthetic reaction centre cytochrome C subunit
MKISRLIIAGVVAAVGLVTLSISAGHLLTPVSAAPIHVAQAPQAAPAEPHHHDMPAPTNLQVLPKNLTGEQVHEIMEGWEGMLGTSCKTCHVEDKKNLGPNGRPRMNFADDSKDEKKTARVMYKMMEDINANYIARIDSSGEPVTCGTCHRGHLGPESFVPAPDKDHDHAH